MEDEKLYFEMSTLIFGCGNILFGDDGFGPAVADFFNANYHLPEDTGIFNVGTTIRKILFNLLLKEEKPELILIIDAVDKGRPAGEIFEINLDDIPENKRDDFSMHQMPSSNLLKELKEEAGINVRILVCQVEQIPPEVGPGLSSPMKDAIPEMCKKVIEILEETGVEVKEINNG